MLITKKKYAEIKNKVTGYLIKILSSYQSVDNTIEINGEKINLKAEKVSRISIDTDPRFYFDFFNSVAKYRERLKQSISENKLDAVDGLESRIKNINSISSKVYQYINIKQEHGHVPIIKCVNDLFGIRVILPFSNFAKAKKMIEEIISENGFKCTFIDASKDEYKALHLYLKQDNYSLRWEVQFWLKKDDKANRLSHAKYKQMYTSWESTYEKRELYEVVV